jgi:hypothetical protein
LFNLIYLSFNNIKNYYFLFNNVINSLFISANSKLLQQNYFFRRDSNNRRESEIKVEGEEERGKEYIPYKRRVVRSEGYRLCVDLNKVMGIYRGVYRLFGNILLYFHFI